MSSVSFGIGFDPDASVRDQAEGRLARAEIHAGLQRLDLGDDAVERRVDHGVVELALRLVDPGLRLQVVWHGAHIDVRIAAEPGKLHRGGDLQRLHRLLVGHQAEAGVVVFRRG